MIQSSRKFCTLLLSTTIFFSSFDLRASSADIEEIKAMVATPSPKQPEPHQFTPADVATMRELSEERIQRIKDRAAATQASPVKTFLQQNFPAVHDFLYTTEPAVAEAKPSRWQSFKDNVVPEFMKPTLQAKFGMKFSPKAIAPKEEESPAKEPDSARRLAGGGTDEQREDLRRAVEAVSGESPADASKDDTEQEPSVDVAQEAARINALSTQVEIRTKIRSLTDAQLIDILNATQDPAVAIQFWENIHQSFIGYGNYSIDLFWKLNLPQQIKMCSGLRDDSLVNIFNDITNPMDTELFKKLNPKQQAVIAQAVADSAELTTSKKSQSGTKTSDPTAAASSATASNTAAPKSARKIEPVLSPDEIKNMTPQKLLETLQSRSRSLGSNNMQHLTQDQLQPQYLRQYPLSGKDLFKLAPRLSSVDQVTALLQKSANNTIGQMLLLEGLPDELLVKINIDNISKATLDRIAQKPEKAKKLLNRLDPSQQSQFIQNLSVQDFVQLMTGDSTTLQYIKFASDAQISALQEKIPASQLLATSSYDSLPRLLSVLNAPTIMTWFEELKAQHNITSIPDWWINAINDRALLDIGKNFSDQIDKIFTPETAKALRAKITLAQETAKIAAQRSQIPQLSPDEIIAWIKAGKLQDSDLSRLTPAQLSPQDLKRYPLSVGDISFIAPLLTTQEQVLTLLQMQPDVKEGGIFWSINLLEYISPTLRHALPINEIPQVILQSLKNHNILQKFTSGQQNAILATVH